MTSFPRGGAENTAPPRCFCRQKRNGLEAGKRESGKAGTKAERKNGGKKGKTKAVRIGKGTTAENGKARGQPRGETEEKKEAPRRRDRSGNLRGAPVDMISRGNLPGVPSSSRRIKNTPALRGCKELFTACPYRCGVSARETRCFPQSGNLTSEGSDGGSSSLGAVTPCAHAGTPWHARPFDSAVSHRDVSGEPGRYRRSRA